MPSVGQASAPPSLRELLLLKALVSNQQQMHTCSDCGKDSKCMAQGQPNRLRVTGSPLSAGTTRLPRDCTARCAAGMAWKVTEP